MASLKTTTVAAFDIGTRNFAVCIATVSDFVYIKYWNVVDLQVHKTYNGTRVQTNLNTFMNEIKDFIDGCDLVLIEKQMSRVNFKATRLSYHLESWMNIVCPNVKTQFYHASNKTKVFSQDRIVKKDDRKKYCISFAIEKLGTAPESEAKWLGLMLDTKKQDDLCDTYAMIWAYATSKHLINS